MKRWQGKVAVVTGTSAGIGTTIAEKLVENGFKVVGLARRKEKLDELEGKLNKCKKGKFIGRKADVSNKEDIVAAFKWINDNVGPISLLINNAAYGTPDPIINGNLDTWKQILDTNVYGLTVATSLALKNMQENNIDGHIININSVAGHKVLAFANQNVYPTSKYAVTAFTETVRKELAILKSKIRITSLSPGFVDSKSFERNKFTEDPEFKKLSNTAPQLQTEDVANAVLYIVGAPPHVQITELTIQPTGETF